MTEAWYVLHSKPRKEHFLAEQLRLREIDLFYPQHPVKTVNPRARKVRPYFPGYVFVRIDLDRQGTSLLDWMPGATGLVAFGGEPARVSDALIQAIRKQVMAIHTNNGESQEGLKTGDRIMVHSGPFSGYEAIFDARLSGNERVRVLLSFLSDQQVALDLPASQIRRKLVGNRQFIKAIS